MFAFGSASPLYRVAAAARVGVVALALFVSTAGTLVWLAGSSNPYTPAGYVGYVTRGAVFGRSSFYATQRGPTSPGRGWLLRVANVSVTPYTYNDDFVGDDAVLSRDNLMIGFRVHTVWRVDDQQVPLFMERFSTTVTNSRSEEDPDAIVKVAYGNFIREPLRTYARDEVQRRNGLEVKDALVAIGDAVLARIRAYALNSPFVVTSVVVGNSPNHTVVYIPVGPMGVPVTATIAADQGVATR